MAIISKNEQDYYKATMRMILQFVNDHPNEWTQWIYANCVRGKSFADYRKTLQLLKQLEFEGKLTKKKNAINNYLWLITDAGREFLKIE